MRMSNQIDVYIVKEEHDKQYHSNGFIFCLGFNCKCEYPESTCAECPLSVEYNESCRQQEDL